MIMFWKSWILISFYPPPPPPRFGEGVVFFFICFEYDFHVDAGRMIVKTREI